MDLSKQQWDGAEQFDAAYLDLARALLSDGRIGSVRDLLFVAGRHRDLWESDDGIELLGELIALLLAGLAEGRIADVVPALAICPPDLAITAIDLLLDAFYPDRMPVDLDRLEEPALVCLALLVAAAGRRDQALHLIDQARSLRGGQTFRGMAAIVRDHLAESIDAL